MVLNAPYLHLTIMIGIYGQKHRSGFLLMESCVADQASVRPVQVFGDSEQHAEDLDDFP